MASPASLVSTWQDLLRLAYTPWSLIPVLRGRGTQNSHEFSHRTWVWFIPHNSVSSVCLLHHVFFFIGDHGQDSVLCGSQRLDPVARLSSECHHVLSHHQLCFIFKITFKGYSCSLRKTIDKYPMRRVWLGMWPLVECSPNMNEALARFHFPCHIN